MIIPTPEFDPLFADDGIPFRQKMLDYIEREFADVLETPTAPHTSAALRELRASCAEGPPPPTRKAA